MTIDANESYRVRISAELLDYDNTTVIDLLNDLTVDGDGNVIQSQAFGAHFTPEFNGPGEGSISVPADHPAFSQVVEGRFIRVSGIPDDDPSEEKILFSFRIEGDPEYKQVEQGEEIALVVEARGRGAATMMEDVIVDRELTEKSDETGLDYSHRLFGPASYWYPNFGDWVAPNALYEYKDQGAAELRGRLQGIVDNAGTPDDDSDDVTNIYVAPVGFPWPNAYHNGDGAPPTPTYAPTYWFIAGDAADEYVIGYHCFRGNFDLDGEQEISFFVTADNFFTLYIDGIPVLGEDDDWHMWQGWKEITLTLPEGFYVIGLIVENRAVVALTHPGAGLFNAIATSVYAGDAETSLTLSVLSSDDSSQWISTFRDEELPGWTPGQIMAQLIQEWVNRGALVSFGGTQFGDFLDANLGPWDSADIEADAEFIPTFSVKLGTDGLEVLNQLYAEGWVDWDWNYETNELRMYAQGTHGELSTAVFFYGGDDEDDGNIRSLIRGASKSYANALLVQFSNGFVWVEDAAEIASAGRRVEDFMTTDARTRVEAERLGRVELRRKAITNRTSILIEVEPKTLDDVPLFTYGLGDYVQIPNKTFTDTEEQQMLAVTVDTDRDNYALWRLELNSRWRAPSVELASVIKTIGGKTMGSPVRKGGVASD